MNEISPLGMFTEYLGIPFAEKGRSRAGCDCWGLPRLIYLEQLGLELPSYADEYAPVNDSEREDIHQLLDAGRTCWARVALTDARPFDLLELASVTLHVGIVVVAGRMLHVQRGGDSHVVPYNSGAWLGRVLGCYRHARLIHG